MTQVQIKSGVKRAAVVLVVAALATVGLIALGIKQSLQSECEVCITFQGRTNCRSASAPTEEKAIEAAIQNACAMIAAGMTQSVQCQNVRPDSIVCE